MNPVYVYIKQALAGFYTEAEAAELAKWVLTEAFRLSAVELYAGKDTDFSFSEKARLEDILSRLKRYEPLQYILGNAVFCGLPFEVTPDVLIPRPETKELVDWIADDHAGRSGLRVLDVGTGSGCISVALSKRLDACKVVAWDASERALQVAERNSRLNGTDITFAQVDVLAGSVPPVRTDILVSNPPYVTEKEREDMERNVLDWEPAMALFVPDDDPLRFYRRIAEIGDAVLDAGGCLYYEINRAYGAETVGLLRAMGYRSVELRKDSFGNDRMVKAVRP